VSEHDPDGPAMIEVAVLADLVKHWRVCAGMEPQLSTPMALVLRWMTYTLCADQLEQLLPTERS
jgi:hypothetical protein